MPSQVPLRFQCPSQRPRHLCAFNLGHSTMSRKSHVGGRLVASALHKIWTTKAGRKAVSCKWCKGHGDKLLGHGESTSPLYVSSSVVRFSGAAARFTPFLTLCSIRAVSSSGGERERERTRPILGSPVLGTYLGGGMPMASHTLFRMFRAPSTLSMSLNNVE